MTLAARFNWTPAQVDATDPDLVAEFLTFIQAEADEREYQAKQQG